MVKPLQKGWFYNMLIQRSTFFTSMTERKKRRGSKTRPGAPPKTRPNQPPWGSTRHLEGLGLELHHEPILRKHGLRSHAERENIGTPVAGNQKVHMGCRPAWCAHDINPQMYIKTGLCIYIYMCVCIYLSIYLIYLFACVRVLYWFLF